MSLSLRDDQAFDAQRVLAHLLAGTSAIYALPTAGGKTRVLAHTLRSFADANGGRVLFLAPLEELLYQAEPDLHAAGLTTKIAKGVQGVRRAFQGDARVVLATMHSMARAVQEHASEFQQTSLIAVDEAHMTGAESYGQIFEALPDAVRFGVTATPTRTDKRSLGRHFRKLVTGLTSEALERRGVLASVRLFAPTTLDLSKARRRNGQYSGSALAKAMQPLLGDLPSHYWRLARGRKGIVFAQTIKQAEAITRRFNSFTQGGERVVRAECITSATNRSERELLLERFRNGEFDLLVNVDLFIQGLNVPDVDCVILCRRTDSLRVYLQAIGRGRRNPSGRDLVVLDHGGNALRFGHPNTPYDWSLHEEDEVLKRGNGEGPRARKCGSCGAILAAGTRRCPCGASVTSDDFLLVDDTVYLQELKPDPEELDPMLGVPVPHKRDNKTERRRVAKELLGFAHQRGFKKPKGWTFHTLEALYGYCEFDVYRLEPVTPSDRTATWARAKLKAFAKRKGRSS